MPAKKPPADRQRDEDRWWDAFRDNLQTFHARLPLLKDATDADLEGCELRAARQADRMVERLRKRFGG